MNRQLLVVLLLISLLGVVWYIDSRIPVESPQQTTPKNCIPTFADGDGPYYLPNAPKRTKLVPDQNNGTKLVVRGRLLRRDCETGVGGATLDIWQADEGGNYQNDWYRGQITTQKDGSYEFETVQPKGYGEGTAFRPPHIHFKVHEMGKLLITSEMFFPDVLGKEGFNEAFVMKLKQKGNTLEGYHDVILP